MGLFKESIKSVVISRGITTTGNDVFANCENLSNVEIPNIVKKICYEAFYGCKKLKSIIVPNSVDEVDFLTFIEYENLKKIIMYRNTLIVQDSDEQYIIHNKFNDCDAEIIYLD